MKNCIPNSRKQYLLIPVFLLVYMLGSCSRPGSEVVKMDRIAYVSEGVIHVVGLNDGTHTKVGKGFEPSLSFDGRYLAYVTNVGNKQRIAVFDFPNRNTSIIDDVQGTSWGPSWSPTENWFLFSARAQANGHDYRVVITGNIRDGKKFVLSRPGIDIFSPAWAPDGETVYGHDGRFLYQWEKTGHLVRHFDMYEKFGRLRFNSSTVVLPSPEGSRWLIATGGEEPAGKLRRTTLKLHVYDEAAMNIEEVSPDNVFIGEVHWGEDNNTIIFSGKDRRNQPQTNIYQLSLEDGSVKPLLKNAGQPFFRSIQVAQSR